MPESIQKECYPKDVPSTNPMENKDVHIAFYGQIVDAYIIEEWFAKSLQSIKTMTNSVKIKPDFLYKSGFYFEINFLLMYFNNL